MIKEALRARRPLPSIFADPPQPFFGTDIFFQAFQELSRERETAPGSLFPIKQRDIRDWVDRAGYMGDLDFADELTSHVRALDAVWLEVTRDQAQSAALEAKREEARKQSEARGRGKSS